MAYVNLKKTFLIFFLAIIQVQISYSDHNLYEFEKYCNIAWDGDIGKVECAESVSYEFILREIARQDGIWMKVYFIVEGVIFDLLRKGAVLMIVEISNVKNNLLSLL